MRYAIIGGTNIEHPNVPYSEEVVSTPYGDVILFRCNLPDGSDVVFLSRHGVLEHLDPGDINYRANIFALHMLGVTHVVGVSSIGTCDYTYHLGGLCLISDFIDFTKSRPVSFEPEYRKYLHPGMEDVFDDELNDRLERLILKRGLCYNGRAVYACMEGPRFETAAETRMMRLLGAQVVGMTLVPEAPLALDLGMKYAALGIISNFCTGMSAPVTDESIDKHVTMIRDAVMDLVYTFVTCENFESV